MTQEEKYTSSEAIEAVTGLCSAIVVAVMEALPTESAKDQFLKTLRTRAAINTRLGVGANNLPEEERRVKRLTADAIDEIIAAIYEVTRRKI